MKSRQQQEEDTMPLLDDGLPSYDSATLPGAGSGSGAGPSSAAGPSSGHSYGHGQGQVYNPDGTAKKPIPGYFFHAPAKAERFSETYPRLEGLQISPGKRGNKLWVSDKRLGDPAVLFDFLRLQASQPPRVKVKCYGAHKEERCRSDGVGNNSGNHTKDTVTVVDFDFYIDLDQILSQASSSSTHLVPVPPNIPTFRGTLHYSYGGYGPTAGRGCNAAEKRVFKREWTLNSALGVPIWDMHPAHDDRSPDHAHVQLSSHNQSPSYSRDGDVEAQGASAGADGGVGSGGPGLMEWCEAYCASPGPLKELVLRKQLYGWDLIALERAVRQTIASTGYNTTNCTVTIDIEDAELHVGPDNWISRVKAQSAFAFFLICFIGCLTLVLPVVYILRDLGIGEKNRFIGGAPWKVAYATYALKSYPPLPGTYANESIDQARARLPGMFKLYPQVPRNAAKGLVQGPKGVHYLHGRKEGEWFKEWEERIRMGVQMHHKGELRGTVVGEPRMPSLDGYDE